MIEFELIDRGWAWKLERFLNDAYAWHVDHGVVWKVLHNGKWVGVLAVTDLCGLGVICHFNCDPGVDPRVGLSAMKAGIEFLRRRYPAVYASITEDRTRFSLLLKRLGFIRLRDTARRINGKIWCLYLLRQSKTKKNEK